MAISVTLDIYNETVLDTPAGDTGAPQRFIRVGMVEGIDVTVVAGSPKYEAMFLARTAVIAACNASPLTNHPELFLRRIVLDPLSDTTALARIIYETITTGTGVPPSTYVLTDGAILATEQSNMFVDANGKRRKITAEWKPPQQNLGASAIPEDFIMMPALLPMRTIQVDALIYGRPTQGQGYIGYVNHANWPTVEPSFPGQPTSGPTPKPRGYWLLFEYLTRLFKTSGYYTLSAKAVTRVNRDWSDGGTLIDTRTGKYIQVGATISEGDQIIDALFQSQYENDIVRAVRPGGSVPCGFVRVGRYHVCDFSSIFGF